MILVDIGCATHGRMSALDESFRPLIRRFKPDIYFGFDIYPGMLDGETLIEDTRCVFARRAAWTCEGILGVEVNSNMTHIQLGTVNGAKDIVASFDLGGFISLLPDGPIVKMDIEGAEYPVLWNIYERGIDKRIELLLVEWHPDEWANGFKMDRPPLRCQVEEWH